MILHSLYPVISSHELVRKRRKLFTFGGADKQDGYMGNILIYKYTVYILYNPFRSPFYRGGGKECAQTQEEIVFTSTGYIIDGTFCYIAARVGNESDILGLRETRKFAEFFFTFSSLCNRSFVKFR